MSVTQWQPKSVAKSTASKTIMRPQGPLQDRLVLKKDGPRRKRSISLPRDEVDTRPETRPHEYEGMKNKSPMEQLQGLSAQAGSLGHGCRPERAPPQTCRREKLFGTRLPRRASHVAPHPTSQHRGRSGIISFRGIFLRNPRASAYFPRSDCYFSSLPRRAGSGRNNGTGKPGGREVRELCSKPAILRRWVRMRIHDSHTLASWLPESSDCVRRVRVPIERALDRRSGCSLIMRATPATFVPTIVTASGSENAVS